MTRGLGYFWGEESVWFYSALDTDGFVIRQVDPAEPSSTVLPAEAFEEV